MVSTWLPPELVLVNIKIGEIAILSGFDYSSA